MKRKTEIVIKIPSYSVGEDCLQIKLRYKDLMTIFSPAGIIFKDMPNQDYVHKYLEDERRKQFPYSNIPVHNRKIFFKKYKFANQLLDFETTYLTMTEIGLVERFAVKKGNEALIFNKSCQFQESVVRYLTKAELDELLSVTEDFGKYIFKGNEYIKESKIYNGLPPLKESTLVEYFKKYTKNQIAVLEYKDQMLWMQLKQNMGRLIENATIDDIPENFYIDDIIMITTNMKNNDITIQKISIEFMNLDCYKVEFSSIPITRCTLEQLKSAKIYESKKTKINPRLNPEIDVAEIQLAERLVLEKKTNK